MNTPAWLEIYVVVIGVAVVLQLGVLVALYLGFRDLQVRIQVMMDRDLQPLLSSARLLVESSRKELDRISGTLQTLSDSTRAQIVKVDQVMSEASDRARLQVIRVDQMVADTLDRMEHFVNQVEKSLVKPVRELQAVLYGIRAAVDYLFSRRRRSPERATQDEELFI